MQVTWISTCIGSLIVLIRNSYHFTCISIDLNEWSFFVWHSLVLTNCIYYLKYRSLFYNQINIYKLSSTANATLHLNLNDSLNVWEIHSTFGREVVMSFAKITSEGDRFCKQAVPLVKYWKKPSFGVRKCWDIYPLNCHASLHFVTLSWRHTLWDNFNT